jgi:hypothetical protein
MIGRLRKPVEQPFHRIALENELVILASLLGALEQAFADRSHEITKLASQVVAAST